MQSGQAVYVFVHGGLDMKVWDALKQAWTEQGVEAHVLLPWDIMGMTKEAFDEHMKDSPRASDGWKELAFFRGEYLKFFPDDVKKEFGEVFSDADYRRTNIPQYLNKHPEITHIYAGEGGGSGWIEPYDDAIIKKHGDKFMGNFIYYRPIDLLSKASAFPTDVWNMVEEKILRVRPFVSEVTFQDAEGSNLHWFMTPEQAQRFAGSMGRSSSGEASNHISIYPNPMYSTLAEGGVLVAHANHTGVYPTMKVFLDKFGQIAKIEGGGKLAQMFNILLNHPLLKNAQFPKAPEPGYWYLRQDGYATNPKFVEDYPAMVDGGYYLPNINERNRAGVQHFAFSYGGTDPEDVAYAKERGIPVGGSHTAHMHNYFGTVKWKLRDTGEWITIGEKGYVKAYDDPEVRALAARYGDPALVFRYEWIPSLPGINTPGDYQKDFAKDPWAWYMKEWKQIQDGTYAHYVEDYAPTNKQVAENGGQP